MTSVERLLATMDAVAYVVDAQIPGAFVECGVWKGGSVLAMIEVLRRLGVDDRDIVLFDTFEGMTAPTAEDTSVFDGAAASTFDEASSVGRRAWGHMFDAEVYGHEQVRGLLVATGYPAERIHFAIGPVEETLPGDAPDQLALMRLDTDWYNSTKHELEHLYPRLSVGGVLIVDDYGHWQGARQAVDEYFDTHGRRPLLARTDYTGRLAIKR